jgi:hypothetical protein
MTTKAQLADLVRNPGQMRTRFSVEKLAELTLQMWQFGWLPDRLALVRPLNGNGVKREIVKGHRRHMCYLMSLFLKERYPYNGEGEVPLDLEKVAAEWQAMIAECGGVEGVVEQLLAMYGHVEIDVVEFMGDAVQGILELQGDNFGNEDPDPLGIAQSLAYGRGIGASLDKMAAAMGQTVAWAEKHLHLTMVDPELAERIATGKLSPTVATLLVSLSDDKRKAATRLVKSMEPVFFKVAKFQDVVVQLRKWDGLVAPMHHRHQQARNVARSIAAAWNRLLSVSPESAWYVAAHLLYADKFQPMPWETVDALETWLDAMGLGNPSQHWTVRLPLVGIECQHCPVNQLPRERLETDLVSPPLACRMGHQVGNCWHGLTPDDPFDVRVSPVWAGLPGVVQEGGHYRVRSYENLMAAWEAQRDREAADREQRASAEAVERAKAEKEAKKQAKAADKKGEEKAAEPERVEATAPPAPAVSTGPSPIEIHRQKIQDYIELHVTMRADHVLATPCALCQHNGEDGRCAWDSRLRSIDFSVIELGGGVQVPVCHQYMPNQDWASIIPHYPQPAAISREWLVAQIKALVKGGPSGGNEIRAFQFLTGRPMSSSENYAGWFEKRLDEELGNLADAQLFTLFVLAHGERQRHSSWHASFWAPADNTFTQILQVQTGRWPQGGRS